jgi:hypothetical protein
VTFVAAAAAFAALVALLHPMHKGLASWYDDREALACKRASLGVASLAVPCGRRVRLCRGGCVTATVDDHGPYVTGRIFDLNERVRRAIRCPDLCHLRWAVVR